jgi:transcriptional regulator with XRE-family HTH domain
MKSKIEVDLTLAEAIKLFRTRNNLTQKELAEMASTSDSTISRLEHGYLGAPLSTITRIVESLGFGMRYKLTPKK